LVRANDVCLENPGPFGPNAWSGLDQAEFTNMEQLIFIGVVIGAGIAAQDLYAGFICP
jgi:hypothetical protein